MSLPRDLAAEVDAALQAYAFPLSVSVLSLQHVRPLPHQAGKAHRCALESALRQLISEGRAVQTNRNGQNLYAAPTYTCPPRKSDFDALEQRLVSDVLQRATERGIFLKTASIVARTGLPLSAVRRALSALEAHPGPGPLEIRTGVWGWIA